MKFHIVFREPISVESKMVPVDSAFFPNKKQKPLERDEAIGMQDKFVKFFLFLLHFVWTS